MSKKRHIARDEINPRLRRIIGKPREHFNADGSEKKDYDTFRRARQVADKMQSLGEGEMQVYRCIFCGKWHIGHNRMIPQDEEYRRLRSIIETEQRVINTLRGDIKNMENNIAQYRIKIDKLETDIQLQFYQLKNRQQ